jgi:hypothetical protein
VSPAYDVAVFDITRDKVEHADIADRADRKPDTGP